MKRLFLLVSLIGLTFSTFAQGRTNNLIILNKETGESLEVIIPDDQSITISEENWEDSVKTYIEKARWGDNDARIKLADCYHYGLGVKQSFINMMSVLSWGGEAGEQRFKDYMANMDPDDDFRLIYELMEHNDSANIDKLMGSRPEIIEIFEVMAIAEEGREEEAIVLLEEAANKGNEFATMLLLGFYEKEELSDDLERTFLKTAQDTPVYYNKLGQIYIDRTDPDSTANRLKALEFYKKADEYAVLSKRGATALLAYYQNEADKGNPLCDAAEMERLRLFAK